MAFTVKAQTSINDCQRLIQETHRALNQLAATDEKQQMFLEYQVTVTYQGDQQVQDQVKFYGAKTRSRLESNTATVYTDQQTQVAVLKNNQTILVTAQRGEAQQQARMDQWLQQQDSLLAKNQIVACETVSLAGQSYRKITLEPYQAWAGLRQMTFWIDETRQQFKKIQMAYREGQPMQTVTYNIVHADYHYTSTIFSGTALAQVMNAQGQLRSPYTAYHLKDLRTLDN